MPVVGRLATFNDTGYRNAAYVRKLVVTGSTNIVKTHAQLILEHIQHSMQEPKHGRTYEKPDGRIHIASAPGESPAIDYGKLFGSLRIKNRGRGMIAEVGSFRVDYAPGLEEGFHVEPRPFLTPAVAYYEARFISSIVAMIHTL